MALHPLELPREAALLFRVVVLLKRLLKALADPALKPGNVDTAWVQQVWSGMEPEWVRRFCLGGQESRVQAIANASPRARMALYVQFCRQNKVGVLLDAGGDFRDLQALPDINPTLATNISDFFKKCYELLGHDSRRHWRGYAFSRTRVLNRAGYREAFCSTAPTSDVCPYCDGDIGEPDLDHYLPKQQFPLLACSPWNLVPVCKSCNNAIVGKGESPPISDGQPRCMDEWLHPFLRPASPSASIRLSGSPSNSIPRLHSPDPLEQRRLDNHFALVQTPTKRLADRWTKRASSYYGRLVRHVKQDPTQRSVDEIVRVQLDSHLADRGQIPLSMIHAAVCQAIPDRRPEYREELDAPIALGLI